MAARARNVQTFAEVIAWVLVPISMVLGYIYFSTPVAIRLRIFDMGSDYLAGIVAAIVLFAVTLFWPIPRSHRRAILLLWIIRAGFALGVMLAYDVLYARDATMYFITGKAVSQPLDTIVYGSGTQNVRAIIGLLSSITDSYNALKIIFSYLGLISVYVFYRAAALFLGRDRLELLYILGLFPSYLLWTSILGKDPIVCLGIAIYCYGVVAMIVRNQMTMIVLVLAGLAIAAFIRVWLGLIFITPLVAVYVLTGRLSIVSKFGFLLVAVPAFLFAIQGFSNKFNVETTEDLVRRTDAISSGWAHGGTAQKIEGGFSSVESMVTFMPVGSFAALFRPLPLEVPNTFGTLAGIENAIVLTLFIYGLIRCGFGWVRQPILLWTVLVLMVWSAIYGFASYQNLGTAFRFRAQVAPLLLMLALYLAYVHPVRTERGSWLAWPKRMLGADAPADVETGGDAKPPASTSPDSTPR